MVESGGDGVTSVRAGRPRRRLCRLRRGARACRVDAGSLSRFPAALDFDRAAGVCVTYGTTLSCAEGPRRPQPGETLAVLGASGGVGLAAIELGKIMGARVIACASSDDKLDFAREHGADETINYAKDDLKEALRRVTGGKGVDVIYDPVGGALCRAGAALDRVEGTLSGGRLCRRRDSEDAAQSRSAQRLRRGRRVLGLIHRTRPAGHRANTEQIMQWAADGKLSAHVQAVYALSDAAARAQGHRRAQGDGKDDPASLKERGSSLCARRFAMLRLDMTRDELDRRRQHRGIVGEAEHRHDVRNGVGRQDEISKRRRPIRPHAMRRLAIERAVIGRKQILGERNAGRIAAELVPEAALQRSARPARRLGLLCPRDTISIRWEWLSRPHQEPAILSIASASLMSSSVTRRHHGSRASPRRSCRR